MKRFIVYFLLTITISCDVYAQLLLQISKGIELLRIERTIGFLKAPIIRDGVVLPDNSSDHPVLSGNGSDHPVLPGNGSDHPVLPGNGSFLNPQHQALIPLGMDFAYNQPNLRKIVISTNVQSTVRGLDNKKLNVSLTRSPSEQKNIENKLQKEEYSQKRMEKLRKKVHDKINKVNRMRTKGDIYMIYGHIIIINDNGEYYTNYAA